MSSVASILHTHPLLEWHLLPNYSLIFTFAFENSHEIWMSFLPHSVLTLLSWAPASPIWAFMMLSCHQLDLIWSVPSPAWRYCAPLAGMVGWDVALSDLLIKPAIRSNSGLQMSSLVSQVCQTVVGQISLIHLLALSQFPYLCTVWRIWYNVYRPKSDCLKKVLPKMELN